MKKILSVLLAVLTVAAMCTVASAEQYRDPALPEGYKQVEYLESTNKQMIDTGILPTNTVKAEIKYQVTNSSAGGTSKTAGVFGSNKDGGTADCTINVAYKTEAFNATFRVGPGSVNVNTSIPKDQDIHVVKLDCTGNCSMEMDGQAIITGTSPFVNTADAPAISMFATRYGKQSTGITASKMARSYSRIFYAKIWSGAILVRDYIPAVNSVGSAGMYDKVSGTFFMDALNTEAFIVGPEVQAAPVQSGAVESGATNPGTTPPTGDRLPIAFVGIALAGVMMTAALVRRKRED